MDENTRVTPTIFTSQVIVPNLLFTSRRVMITLGMNRQQDSISTGHPPPAAATHDNISKDPLNAEATSKQKNKNNSRIREKSIGGMRHQSARGRARQREAAKKSKEDNSAGPATYLKQEGSDTT